MSDCAYKDVNIGLSRIYTKRGDGGDTNLVGGTVVAKDALRIAVYGEVDELNAMVGVARVSADEAFRDCTGTGLTPLSSILLRVQHELFNLGSLLATEPKKVGARQPQIAEADVDQLEREIDRANIELTTLPSFVLPGGCRINAELHACRTICRRAERSLGTFSRDDEVPETALRYVNRLSDAFFVWSRWASLKLGAPEVLWQPNEAASGSQE